MLLSGACFEAFPAVRHGFSTRSIDWQSSVLNMPQARMVTLDQQHTAKVVEVAALDVMDGKPPIADAAITNLAQCILAVRTADCLPLLMHDPRHHAIAAVHAGWRGLVGGVIENTVECLQNSYSTIPTDLRVALGPAISACCFDVQSDVRDQFCSRDHSFEKYFQVKDEKHWRLNLKGCARDILLSLAIPAAQIDVNSHCTYCEPQLFYSFRRDGNHAGRLWHGIGLIT